VNTKRRLLQTATRAIAVVFVSLLFFMNVSYAHGYKGDNKAVLYHSSQGTSSPDEIIARAKTWVDADPQVAYDEGSWYQGYREDCSGFVSMAWGLSQPGLTTYTLPKVSHQISKDELQPGDILLNQWGGWAVAGSPDAHVVIFDGWTDSSHTHYNAYEENPFWGGAHYTQNIPYPFWPGYDSSDYLPMRFNSLSNPPGPTVNFSPFVGNWYGHARGLTFSLDGHAKYAGRVFRWCSTNPPPCDSFKGDEIIGGLNENLQFTQVIGSTAYGTIVSGTDDPGSVYLKVGSKIAVTLEPNDKLSISDGAELCGPKTPSDDPTCSGA